MSKLLMIVGILLAALGVTTGLMVAFSSGQMQILGITPEVAAILLTGGFINIGLGGLIDIVSQSGRVLGEVRERITAVEREATGIAARRNIPVPPAAEVLRSETIPPVAVVPDIIARSIEPGRQRIEEVTDTVRSDTEKMIAEARRTSEALDRAKAEIEEAFAPEEITVPAAVTEQAEEVEVAEVEAEDISPRRPPAEVTPAPVAEVVAEPEPEPEEVVEEETADDQLYVVEERMIRGRPARVLSDGTVEAETDEGWMRFENLEHLEEYLEAMSPNRS